jgi:hypothetical protein
MSDILAKLKASRTATKTFQLLDLTLALRILTERDYQEAGWAANAMLDAHDTELSAANADLFESEKASHLIQRFLIEPETGKPVFPSAAEVVDTLSRDERNAIGAAYYDFEKEYSPSERTLSEADFASLLADAKKKPDWTYLSGLSGALLKRLALSLAAQQTS